MPRPRRCRMISAYPEHWCFVPEESKEAEPVIMSLDEYETIRLIDREDLTQQQCAERMQVARTTVTSIYESARKKLATALIDGRVLKIEGGDYSLYDMKIEGITSKGDGVMRLAVTYENGEVFGHFGHTEQFALYDIEDGKIVNEQIIGTDGFGHGALAGFLKNSGADALICGGIGMGARNALAEAGVELYPGVSGNAREAAEAFAAGNLEYNADATCNHHGHGHGEGHSCGGHGHGEGHGCGGHGHGEGHGCGGHGHHGE